MGLTVKDPGQGGRLLQVGLTQIFWKVGLEPIKRAALFLLTPPPQTATQQSKEGCPARLNTEGPALLQLNRCAKTKKGAKFKRKC